MNVVIWEPWIETLAGQLAGLGIQARRINESVMLVYPPWQGRKYLMPPLVSGKIMLVSHETGCGHRKNGKAKTVCHLDGRPMKVFRILPWDEQGFEGIKAEFMTDEGIVSVEASRRSNIVTVKRHLIQVKDGIISIKHETIGIRPLEIAWQCMLCGNIEGNLPKHCPIGEKDAICLAGMKIKKLVLPPEFEIYREAIIAALLKASCYHCCEVHFSKER